MTFSSKANPRIAQSGVALTSLGAVGGARGTAAGALRIFVEFLTTYDKKAISQLEGDLQHLETVDKNVAKTQAARNREQQQLRVRQAQQVAALRIKGTKEIRDEMKLQDSLQGARSKADRAERAASEIRLRRALEAEGFSKRDISNIENRYVRQKRSVELERQSERFAERAQERSKRRLQTEGDINKIQNVRAQLAPRLAGLAIGAVGGILGGAVLGIGFQLAEAAIAKLGDVLQDLIDPARHAREEVEGLAKSVNELAASQNIRTFEAAQRIVQGFGVDPQSAKGTQAAQLLNEIALRQRILEAIKQESQLMDVQAHKQQLDVELRKAVAEQLRKTADYHYELVQVESASSTTGFVTRRKEYIGTLEIEAAITQKVSDLTGALADDQYELAAATERAAQAAANASALWNVYAQSLANAINQATALATSGIDNKIEAVRDAGPSKKTRGLEGALDRARSAPKGDGGAQARQLANIAEERALLLLKMRLRLLGTNINLEKYSGKFLLVAINAKIAALQKEGDAQQRVNQLLNIQYRLSQEAQRNEGESIESFLERRANEQREMLAERDDIQRQAQIAALENRKEALEDELALEALAEKKRDALRKSGTDSHVANLEKQLAASRRADEKARRDKIKALEKQKKDLEKAAAEAINLASETSIKETKAAIAGMTSVEKIGMFSGRLSGLQRAKSSLEALVQGFGLPRAVAQPFLDKLNGMIRAAKNQAADVVGRTNDAVRGPNLVHSAKGGVFALTNASTMFGSNVRTGEEGTELGVVLSHNVAKILQAQQDSGKVGQIGPIYIEKSADPYRDAYRMRKAVQAGLEGALG